MYGHIGMGAAMLLARFMREADRAERRLKLSPEARTRTMRRCHDQPPNPFISRQVRRAMEREAAKRSPKS